jgi:hypothetical protein
MTDDEIDNELLLQQIEASRGHFSGFCTGYLLYFPKSKRFFSPEDLDETCDASKQGRDAYLILTQRMYDTFVWFHDTIDVLETSHSLMLEFEAMGLVPPTMEMIHVNVVDHHVEIVGREKIV